LNRSTGGNAATFVGVICLYRIRVNDLFRTANFVADADGRGLGGFKGNRGCQVNGEPARMIADVADVGERLEKNRAVEVGSGSDDVAVEPFAPDGQLRHELCDSDARLLDRKNGRELLVHSAAFLLAPTNRAVLFLTNLLARMSRLYQRSASALCHK
jgi:hypothetical protein